MCAIATRKMKLYKMEFYSKIDADVTLDVGIGNFSSSFKKLSSNALQHSTNKSDEECEFFDICYIK